MDASSKPIQCTALAFLAFLVMTGCGSSRYTVVEPVSEPVSNFSVLEIRDFASNLSDEDAIELANRFADRLHLAVMKDRKANPEESIFDEVVRATNQTGNVLVLEGTVISFEKGSRAKRYFIGFGAGKAYCTIQAIFTNKLTGEQVVKANFDGELSMSVFGGSPEEAVDAVVRAFIDYFDDYFEREGIKGS